MGPRAIATSLWLSRTLRAGLVAALSSQCGGSPTKPGPVTPPPPPANEAPVISSLTASANRAEVGDTLDISAAVQDTETALDKLIYRWTAEGGSIDGEGASVRWRAGTLGPTPANVNIRLTVTEPYPALNEAGQIVIREHKVESSPVIVRVHDSANELGNMGRSFLQKFATTPISPEACLVDFSDSCQGKLDELGDIRNNRIWFVIQSHTLGMPRVTISSPYRRADMVIACSFESFVKVCPPGDSKCVPGTTGRSTGDCFLTAVYEQDRWWLCDSRFFSTLPLTNTMRQFFGASRSQSPIVD
jgi:hypothetical protein